MATNGASFTQQRHFVDVMQDVVVRQREQRRLPELCIVLADEVVVEDDAGEQRADGQQEQRHQHHRRRFMHMVHDLVRWRAACRGRS